MEKKVITGTRRIIVCLLVYLLELFFLVAICFGGVVALKKELYILGGIFIILSLLGVLLITIEIFSCLYNKIIFFEDKIVALGENTDASIKAQYKDEIFFKDIEDIKIVVSRNQNSLKKWYLPTGNHYIIREKKPFFEFILKGQESKWVCVYDFSVKQRKEMLKIINERTGLNIDYDNIYSKREEIDVGRTY